MSRLTTDLLDLAGDDPDLAIADAESRGLLVNVFTSAGSCWPAVTLTGNRATILTLLDEWGYTPEDAGLDDVPYCSQCGSTNLGGVRGYTFCCNALVIEPEDG